MNPGFVQVMAVASLALVGCHHAPRPRVQSPPPPRRTPEPPPHSEGLSVQEQFERAHNSFPLDLAPPREDARAARALLLPNFHEVAKTFSFVLNLPRDVPIHVRACGSADAFYDHQRREIVLCDELLTELANLEPDARTFRAAVMFCVFHEVAHSIVALLGLPVEGVEGGTGETWADLFASLLFTETAHHIGTDSAARFFRTLARSEKHDPEDPHLPSATRAAAVRCMDEGTQPDARPACRTLHDTAKAHWNAWLRPYSRIQSGNTF
jgi:hypothetical protein